MKNDESFGNYCENCEKRKASPNCEHTKKIGLAFKLQMENTHEYFVGYFQKEFRIRSVSMRNDMWYFVANLPNKQKKTQTPYDWRNIYDKV